MWINICNNYKEYLINLNTVTGMIINKVSDGFILNIYAGIDGYALTYNTVDEVVSVKDQINALIKPVKIII